MEIQSVIKALEKNRYSVSYFTSTAEAADYLDRALNHVVIGFGDSVTLSQMRLYEKLSTHNKVYDPKQSKNNDEFLDIAKKCLTTEFYLTSVNAMSETGELVNIDGTGNRIAGSLFGHKKVYFVIGINKVESNLEKAIWRARNISAPQNAKRLGLRTPCAIKGDHCYNCSSPDRICNALTIYWKKMNDVDDIEIILIDENLGF
jgi:hypothetical protein